MECSKEQLKEMLVSMFLDGTIKVSSSHETQWESKYLVTTVEIDGEIVCKSKEHIGASGWSDN